MAVADRDDVLAAKIAEAVAAATARATLEVQGKFQRLESPVPSRIAWNNPTGRADRPRLKRKTVIFGGIQEELMLDDEEIELFNKVQPGRYNNRRWEVIERQDGPEDVWLEIRIPCNSRDERMALPGSLKEILRLMIEERKAKDKAKQEKGDSE